MSLFATTVHNYKTNKTGIINVNTERMNALFDMESYVIDFIVTQDGSSTNLSGRQFEKRMFSSENTRSRLPEGHYIVSKCKANRDYTKMCIWRKFTSPVLVKGWFWNSERMSSQWEKIMSVFITEYDPAKLERPASPVASVSSTRRSSRSARAARDVEFDKPKYDKFISTFKTLESVDMLRSPVTIAILRTKFRKEFTKCPLANQKREFLPSTTADESTQDKLCASILMRCKDAPTAPTVPVVPDTPDTPIAETVSA